MNGRPWARELASPTLGYKDGHDFARGTKFKCMATTGDGCIAVGSEAGGRQPVQAVHHHVSLFDHGVPGTQLNSSCFFKPFTTNKKNTTYFPPRSEA